VTLAGRSVGYVATKQSHVFPRAEDDPPPQNGVVETDLSPAAARVLAAVGDPGVLDRLAALSGSDFTSLMLEVARRRAARETPATVVRRYRADRFVCPASSSWQVLRRAEELLTGHLPAAYELLTLAPVVPLGTHSADAGESVAEAVAGELSGPLIETTADPQRESGRSYYRDLCFKINVQSGGQWQEVGDGGFTDWAAWLTASKERLLISGLGIDRLAAMMPS